MPSTSPMLRALSLARRGLGAVEPNPMVGCVLVRGGGVIGEGYHRKFGGPHAEAEALRDCRERGHDPAGADAYVTLEPCCHHGKTPPCADALVEARVGRVFAAMVDPFPRVAGGGVARLREAGIAVEVGLGEAEARRLNEAWLKRVETGLPWVIAKWAQTLDGRIATSTGASKWISNEASRQRVHELRGRVDAILTGIGTVLADDPLLTARPPLNASVKRTARRVVVDPGLRLPEESRLLRTLEAAPVTIGVDERLLAERPARVAEMESRGVELVGLPSWDSGEAASGVRAALDLRALLRRLTERHGATNVLVEAGATLIGSFFAQRLVDQVLVFVAPRVLGDAAAVPAVRGLTGTTIEGTRGLVLRDVKRIGDDVMLDYRVAAMAD